jgi:hypothetical protein
MIYIESNSPTTMDEGILPCSIAAFVLGIMAHVTHHRTFNTSLKYNITITKSIL